MFRYKAVKQWEQQFGNCKANYHRVVKDGVEDSTAMEVLEVNVEDIKVRMVQGPVDECRELIPGESFYKVGSFSPVEESEGIGTIKTVEEDGSTENHSQD